MHSILYHTLDSFAEEIFSSLGKGKDYAKKVYSHWMKKGSLEGIKIEPQAEHLFNEIVALTEFKLPEHSLIQQEEGTVKFLLNLEDRLECETVFIPMKSKSTLCISSQVGCKRGCVFCETGRMGLIRHLTVEEIVAQVFIAVHLLKMKVENIVFMGMGEPFDNFEAVIRAIEILTDGGGLAFGPSKICVSTSGLVDKIDAFGQRADPAVHLAISMNAPNDVIRQKIMPINRKWPLKELRKAMKRFCIHPRRQIFVEYVLLREVNDSLACADELAEFLEGLNVKINLIPYNPQTRDRFSPPSQETIDAFLKHLREKGYLTFLRKTKGQKIRAACGQLGNLQLRKKRLTIAS